jgi:hypothetical protein
MAARTCLYTDPKKSGDGPRLYLTSFHGWDPDPQKAVEYMSLSTASRNHQVPLGYQPSQTVLAETIKVHPAIRAVHDFVNNVREMAPQSIVTIKPPPTDPKGPWKVQIDSPPEKRSLTVDYRYWKGFGPKGLSGDEAVLWAIKQVEPIECRCDCHGPVAGFYHCFGAVCCEELDVPRTNADREARP